MVAKLTENNAPVFKLLPVGESNDVHQSYLELIKRLREDLPSRVLAAIGFTGLLLWGIEGVAAIIWFAAFASSEGLELFIGMNSSKDFKNRGA